MILNLGFSFVSKSCTTQNQTIAQLSDSINKAITTNNYGESIETLFIGLIAVEPVYDKFAKPRRLRYTEHKETMAFGSIPIVIHKTLEIEIKLDYQKVLTAEGEELRKLVATEVLNTLITMKLPKKVTDFNKDQFVKDIELFFESEQLI